MRVKTEAILVVTVKFIEDPADERAVPAYGWPDFALLRRGRTFVREFGTPRCNTWLFGRP
jgi:hypothetical protein